MIFNPYDAFFVADGSNGYFFEAHKWLLEFLHSFLKQGATPTLYRIGQSWHAISRSEERLIPMTQFTRSNLSDAAAMRADLPAKRLVRWWSQAYKEFRCSR